VNGDSSRDDVLGDELERLALLAEPARRSLYLYVCAQDREVSREEAASATGLQRSLAAFHLDKLSDAGLLDVAFRRLSGRRGPGAGRPAKLYRRSSRDHEVSVPPRDYRVAAELLAQAVAGAGAPSREALADIARRSGQELGARVGGGLTPRASRERQLDAVATALADRGYRPYRDRAQLRLQNCPFHAVAERHRDVVCPMNLALVEGVIDGVGARRLTARLEDRPGECCVAVGPTRDSKAGAAAPPGPGDEPVT
jgi:predicted ArsR family transcriptional regulator